MGLLIFMQVVLDLGFIAVTTWLLIDRSKSKTMEDPRLSRGLQLLSSKIAILQDLMDRSETMSRQLSQLIDGKQADIQERMEEFEIYLHKIQRATEKSQEVVDIFQDRVPHQEMIERQMSAKYLMAAKLAHQGLSVDEIAKQVDIPRGELELIAKVNRDRLIVPAEPEGRAEVREPIAPVLQAPSQWSIQSLNQTSIATTAGTVTPAPSTPQVLTHVQPQAPATPKKIEKEIRPVIFKRISVLDDLG